MWKLLSEKAEKDTLKPFLDEMLENKATGMKIPDIESKFHLHKLYRKTTLTRNIFSSVSGFIGLVVISVMAYACRNNFTFYKQKSFPPIRMSSLPSENMDSFISPSELSVATTLTEGAKEIKPKKKKTTS